MVVVVLAAVRSGFLVVTPFRNLSDADDAYGTVAAAAAARAVAAAADIFFRCTCVVRVCVCVRSGSSFLYIAVWCSVLVRACCCLGREGDNGNEEKRKNNETQRKRLDAKKCTHTLFFVHTRVTKKQKNISSSRRARPFKRKKRKKEKKPSSSIVAPRRPPSPRTSQPRPPKHKHRTRRRRWPSPSAPQQARRQRVVSPPPPPVAAEEEEDSRRRLFFTNHLSSPAVWCWGGAPTIIFDEAPLLPPRREGEVLRRGRCWRPTPRTCRRTTMASNGTTATPGEWEDLTISLACTCAMCIAAPNLWNPIRARFAPRVRVRCPGRARAHPSTPTASLSPTTTACCSSPWLSGA